MDAEPVQYGDPFHTFELVDRDFDLVFLAMCGIRGFYEEDKRKPD